MLNGHVLLILDVEEIGKNLSDISIAKHNRSSCSKITKKLAL
jgi:hypothetical protein